ncbi:uncharacterized protein FOMMEDRAFT_22819 [Fomitiporia mediterranea MF3/22]|uniref:uncharacterized protein n=1 Tax=Fomitiporia mediterranea (strain MF3/22) TaxID=694068 RepID=UPI0004407ABA|nr:uncharacterized protein FOMMEDRAFT_22819 [Fomitiporia mediterranea MF3/22]EJC99724.1 hypothetical protein FOMMEDRAFT_22819 [Fomitiporia mediterranea MF3/22]
MNTLIENATPSDLSTAPHSPSDDGSDSSAATNEWTSSSQTAATSLIGPSHSGTGEKAHSALSTVSGQLQKTLDDFKDRVITYFTMPYALFDKLRAAELKDVIDSKEVITRTDGTSQMVYICRASTVESLPKDEVDMDCDRLKSLSAEYQSFVVYHCFSALHRLDNNYRFGHITAGTRTISLETSLNLFGKGSSNYDNSFGAVISVDFRPAIVFEITYVATRDNTYNYKVSEEHADQWFQDYNMAQLFLSLVVVEKPIPGMAHKRTKAQHTKRLSVPEFSSLQMVDHEDFMFSGSGPTSGTYIGHIGVAFHMHWRVPSPDKPDTWCDVGHYGPTPFLFNTGRINKDLEERVKEVRQTLHLPSTFVLEFDKNSVEKAYSEALLRAAYSRASYAQSNGSVEGSG